MKKYVWDIPTKLNFIMLKYLGVWPEGENYGLNLYSFYLVSVTIILVYGMNFFQFVNIFFIDDLLFATRILVLGLNEMGAIFKLHAVVGNLKLLKQLMRDRNDEMFQPKNNRQRVMVEKAVNSWKKVYSVFLIALVITVFFFGAFPLLDGTVEEYRLPFLAWYPYDYKKSPWYEFTYLYQSISLVYIVAINVNVDTMNASLMVFIGAQCDILCDELQHLRNEGNLKLKFIRCVLHHKKILRFASHCNYCLDSLLFAQFFTSAVSLGLSMFLMTIVVPNSNEFYALLQYANAVIFEIFMYCWYGNEVQVKSSIIPSAAFAMDWSVMPEKVKKYILFFMLNTQRPIRISAMNLFNLTLSTFTSIIRTAWSYFCILQNLTAE